MIWPIIAGAAIGAAANMIGGANQQRNTSRMQGATNDMNRDLQIQSQMWNAEQTDREREWSQNQVALARDWETNQAGINREWNAQQAAENRSFQERMSNTQYQRATEDMKAAGLNPMLGYSQGGAGNVGGSTASSQAPSTNAPSSSAPRSGSNSAAPPQRFENILGNSVSSGLQTYNSLVGAEQMEAQTQESKARTLAQIAEVGRIQSQTGVNSATQAQTEATVRRLMYEWEQGLTQRTSHADTEIKEDSSRKLISEVHTAGEEAKQARRQTQFMDMEFPRRSGEAQFHALMNDALKGGASSASGLKDLMFKALSGARFFQSKPDVHIHRGR